MRFFWAGLEKMLSAGHERVVLNGSLGVIGIALENFGDGARVAASSASLPRSGKCLHATMRLSTAKRWSPLLFVRWQTCCACAAT